MAKALGRVFVLITVCLLLGGAFLFGAYRHQSALAQEQNRSADLARYVETLSQDIARLQTRVDQLTVAEKQAKDIERRREIERAVETIRELRFKEPVQYHELDRKDLGGVLLKKMAEQYTDEEFRAISVALTAMGVLPDNFDIRKTLIELLTEQVGAFFDQHEHKLFMFTGWSLENHQDRTTLAHELTHALQDQNFQLAKFPLEIKENDDLMMATSALIEGDATMLMSQYMVENFSLATLRDSMGALLTQDMKKLSEAPAYLRESLVFPYLRGNEFCMALYQRGGWDMITQAFRDPPKSTAQIYHPEKYLSSPREDPIPVEMDVKEVLGTKVLTTNVMGEFGVRLLVSEWLSAKEGERAGEGWRGDRFFVFEEAGGVSVFWKSLWANPRDAEEFRVSMLRVYEKRYKLPPQGDLAADTPFQFDGVRSIRLIRAGNSVLAIDTISPPWAEALLTLPEN